MSNRADQIAVNEQLCREAADRAQRAADAACAAITAEDADYHAGNARAHAREACRVWPPTDTGNAHNARAAAHASRAIRHARKLRQSAT